MTEKQYGGNTGRSANVKSNSSLISVPKAKKRDLGEIAKKVKEYAKTIVKKDISLLEIADKIESKIIELGGGIAFPVNLSINEIAAHYTPSWDDKNIANGLIKIDLGVHISGCIADTAFSLDLENLEENKKLIIASEKALGKALELVKNKKENSKLREIGRTIKSEIELNNAYPIINLSGHSLDDYQIHAGLTIPNCDNNNETELEQGAFAIEPFTTSGLGEVYEGKPSGIFMLQKEANTRDSHARQVFSFILENYKTLPFASRWLVKEFGSRALLSLSILKQQGILHEFPQLIAKSKRNVAQSEESFTIYQDSVEVITN
jgi:methionyl aminopeptidase